MKQLVTIVSAALWILAAAPSVQAQAVALYEDSLGTDCSLYDDHPTTRNVYVVFWGIGDGVRFKIESSPGMTMTYVSELALAPVLEGDTQNGITFCFGQTRIGPVVLAKIQYTGNGTSEDCSEIRSVPYPDSNTLEVVGDGYVTYADGSRLMVNPRATGECGSCDERTTYGPPIDPYDFCQPVSNDITTWGRIKALYR
jgi:hypothetical protein